MEGRASYTPRLPPRRSPGGQKSKHHETADRCREIQPFESLISGSNVVHRVVTVIDPRKYLDLALQSWQSSDPTQMPGALRPSIAVNLPLLKKRRSCLSRPA